MTVEITHTEIPVYNAVETELINYPSYLYMDPETRLLRFHQQSLKEGGSKAYDIVWDFEGTRKSYREPVPEAERVTKDSAQIPGATFLGFYDSEVEEAMSAITEIANNPEMSSNNPQDRVIYREYLAKVYQKLASEMQKRIDPDKTLFFPPKNGGIFVQEQFTLAGIPESQFYDYTMSRVLALDDTGKEHLNVAARFNNNNPDIKNYRNFVFCDDCMASDISAWATLEHLKSELVKAGVNLKEVKIIITVTAATQRGAEAIISKEAQEHFGFGSLELIAAVPVYEMTDKFYLQTADKRFQVGDMGKWSLPPTSN